MSPCVPEPTKTSCQRSIDKTTHSCGEREVGIGEGRANKMGSVGGNVTAFMITEKENYLVSQGMRLD